MAAQNSRSCWKGKWKNKVNAEKILKQLKEKSKFVQWNNEKSKISGVPKTQSVFEHNEKRKEYCAVFAKSFKRKVKEFEGNKVYCFDLKSIEKVLK